MFGIKCPDGRSIVKITWSLGTLDLCQIHNDSVASLWNLGTFYCPTLKDSTFISGQHHIYTRREFQKSGEKFCLQILWNLSVIEWMRQAVCGSAHIWSLGVFFPLWSLVASEDMNQAWNLSGAWREKILLIHIYRTLTHLQSPSSYILKSLGR